MLSKQSVLDSATSFPLITQKSGIDHPIFQNKRFLSKKILCIQVTDMIELCSFYLSAPVARGRVYIVCHLIINYFTAQDFFSLAIWKQEILGDSHTRKNNDDL